MKRAKTIFTLFFLCLALFAQSQTLTPSVLASSGAQLLQDIYTERRLEFAGEGLRFFDLVRSGDAVNEIDNFVPGKHEIFPIPQVEIDLSGGNWNQNPNY